MRMKNKIRPRGWSLGRWYLLSAVWLVLVVLLGLLTLFRAIMTAGVAHFFQVGDVPLLRFFEAHYRLLLWSTVGVAGVFLAGLTAASCALARWPIRSPWEGLCSRSVRCRVATWLPITAGLFVIIGLVECRCGDSQGLNVLGLRAPGVLGWLIVLLAALSGWLMTSAAVLNPRAFPRRSDSGGSHGQRWAVRLAAVYLLGVAAILVEAAWAHWKFWHSEFNGGFDYARFFAAGEIPDANIVFFSTSTTFVSLAALAGCCWFAIFGWLVPAARLRGATVTRRDCRRIAALLAGIWTIALGAPWQIKILADIRDERGWILPAVIFVFLAAGLAPLIAVSLMMLKADFESSNVAGTLRVPSFGTRSVPAT
jgi:hypothetical protein